MSELSLFHGPNAGYVIDLYERYQQDPSSVDATTRALFEQWNPESEIESVSSPVATTDTVPTLPNCPAPIDVMHIVGVARLIRMVREDGHLAAHIDPLGTPREPAPSLDLATHTVTISDLEALPASVVGGPLSIGANNAHEALLRLRKVYSGPVGYETGHIQIPEERVWLYEAIESQRFFEGYPAERKRDLLERLTEVETFETFLDKTTNKAKRFSIEGTDMLVPMLDETIHNAAVAGTREVVMGMAHRGRLNVMAHVLGKPYEAILAEFQDAHAEDNDHDNGRDSQGWSGDVKYHLGVQRNYQESGIGEMPLTLVPNPSHLEFVNPVVEGHVRAAQEDRRQHGEPKQDITAALAVAIHGDAAFPGQGIVAETLNLWNLRGYTTGGTIHIIVNNQIGFTTLPDDGRSTLYAGDLAKGFEIPIVHVNADDPIACLAMARMAHAYRERFHKDFLIDLIGYRRYGHNEGDQPAFTQPKMYQTIATHPRVREIWAKQLESEGILDAAEAAAMVGFVQLRLERAKEKASHVWHDNEEFISKDDHRRLDTGVPLEKLTALNESLLQFPEGFTPDPQLEKTVLRRRRENLTKPGGIDWGHAETLAYASILADGTPIRLAGQDSERGTFGHRNSVLHDPNTGQRIIPLQTIPEARASFAVYNSPLSENAALGFEYGYSIHAPGALVLWEAQFGDFANSAQVIIDQFLVSGSAKWRQIPSLVLLLPHGYEGAGPEHSSARLERFLQLGANDNIRVVNCTTSAQMFHLLRRQAALLLSEPRPLIVMTPKSLLRHPRANSSVDDLVHGTFHSVLDDVEAAKRFDKITRLVLCSGKVYVDLIATEGYASAERVAVARVEELYPFPTKALKKVISGYPNLREIVWLQEEPENMGAWRYMEARLRDPAFIGWQETLRYSGRAESASPAEGSSRWHKIEQARLLASALEDAPGKLNLFPAAPLTPVASPSTGRGES